MLSQKLSVDVGIDTSAGKTSYHGLNPKILPLILLASLLSAPWPWHQVTVAI
jgi:hypothetical protein